MKETNEMEISPTKLLKVREEESAKNALSSSRLAK